MKLLLAGSLHSKHKADHAMREILDLLESADIGVYLLPTSVEPPREDPLSIADLVTLEFGNAAARTRLAELRSGG